MFLLLSQNVYIVLFSSELFQMDLPIWKKNGCDADAITKLINQGMDLEQRCSFLNETVLHYWAGEHFRNFSMDESSSNQKDSLGIVKLLVEKGANLLAKNNWGFTPLLVAANGPNRGTDHLIPNLMVFDFLLKKKDYSRAEKIEAMELVGAVILKNGENASIFHKAFDYWRKALHLRGQTEVDDSGFIGKPRLNLKNVQTVEWSTSAELEDVIEHPDKFVIQSFLVRLRIFSSKEWGAINFLISSAPLDDFIWELHHPLKFVEVVDMIWAMLETLISRSDIRYNIAAQSTIGSVVRQLTHVFSFREKDSSKIWTEEIIKKSLDLIVSATEFYFDTLHYLVEFVSILSYQPQLLLKKDVMETSSKVRNQRGRNLLHEAMRASNGNANLYATVRLLLYAGCDPNAIDEDGNAPLHFLAQ